jgi:hypothetical protein
MSQLSWHDGSFWAYGVCPYPKLNSNINTQWISVQITLRLDDTTVGEATVRCTTRQLLDPTIKRVEEGVAVRAWRDNTTFTQHRTCTMRNSPTVDAKRRARVLLPPLPACSAHQLPASRSFHDRGATAQHNHAPPHRTNHYL